MAKRISKSSINWSSLSERVPSEQRGNFASFKAKSDGYLRRVLANPPEPPKINWEVYQKTVPVSGMVENFKKQYEAVKVPYPPDNLTSKIDAQWNEIKKDIEAFIKASNGNIAEHEKGIKEIQALLPYDQMTMEDFYEAHPDIAIDCVKRPEFWPHTKEEQLGYKHDKGVAESH